MIVALAGGVGGAKLAEGLYRALPPGQLAVIINTADDFTHFGLRICPDLDTVMYTLAGLADAETGWGIAGDSFQALEMLGRYGEPTWFRLGDRDLATHLARTRLLGEGLSLTEVTRHLVQRLGIRATLLPMCNQPVATMVTTPHGELAFQDYFVRQGGEVRVKGLRYAGIEGAQVSREVVKALDTASLIVLCPSNPLLSIEPILSVPGLRNHLRGTEALKVAVSPLVGGRAVRGPLDRLLRDLDYEASQEAIAGFYQDFLDALVVDRRDKGEREVLEEMGLRVLVTETVMTDANSREALARRLLDFARGGERL